MLRLTLVGLLLSFPCTAQCSERPNIILFYADDLDFDEVPLYDQLQTPCSVAVAASRGRKVSPKKLHMPHLERLGREGMVLNRFYITSPICTPSRYSLLTGKYASRSPGFCKRQRPGTQANVQWNTPIDPIEMNVAKALKQCGYATGFVGKWHNTLPGGAVRGLDSELEPSDPSVAPALKKAQQRRISYLREQIGFDYAERIHDGNKESEKIPAALQVHNLAWLAEGAVEFLKRDHDRPFFLYVSVTIPHAGYNPGLLKDNPLATVAGMLDAEPDVMPPKATVAQRAKKAGVEESNFTGTWLDDCVGALTNTLDELHLTDNTLFLFISDHQSRGKYTCYEGARVPAIVRWPAHIPAGAVNDTLSANIDIVPTLVELAGGTLAPNTTVDGHSLLGVWTANHTPDTWRQSLLLECSLVRAVVSQRWKYMACRATPATAQKMAEDAVAAKREGRARLVDWSGNVNPHPRGKGGIRYNSDRHFPAYFDIDQLYDLENDPGEQENLADRPERAATVRQLQKQLSELLQPLPHTFGEFKE